MSQFYVDMAKQELHHRERELFPHGRGLDTILAAVRQELENGFCIKTIDWINVDKSSEWRELDISLHLDREMPTKMLDDLANLIRFYGWEIGNGTCYHDKDAMIDFLSDSIFYRLNYEIKYKKDLYSEF